MKKEFRPNKVKRIVCPKCKELQLKIYPYSSLQMNGTMIPPCRKCLAKEEAKRAGEKAL